MLYEDVRRRLSHALLLRRLARGRTRRGLRNEPRLLFIMHDWTKSERSWQEAEMLREMNAKFVYFAFRCNRSRALRRRSLPHPILQHAT
jgi:hypothetical protein